MIWKLLILAATVLLLDSTVHGLIPPPVDPKKQFNPGMPTYITTPADGVNSRAWYSVEDRRTINFEVKACQSATISFGQFPTIDTTTDRLVIELGASYNKLSTIGGVFDNPPRTSVATPDILCCNEYRSFWIRWSPLHLRVGRGPVVDQNMFMSMEFEDREINALGISTPYSNTGSWIFPENSGDVLTLTTPALYNYGSMWKTVTDRSSFRFRVTACSDVNILLSRGLGDTHDDSVYRITFGANNNTQTTISDGISEHVRATVDSKPLDCLKEKSLWVSWFNDTLKAGRGDLLEENLLINWTSSATIPIRALSVATNGVTGRWNFNENREPETYVYTPKQVAKEYKVFWIQLPRKQSLKFSVRACAEASIILSEKKMNTERATEISIGVNNNQKLEVRQSDGQVLSVDDPNRLDCEESKYFWVTWTYTKMEFGAGIYMDNRILVTDIELTHRITAIGFTTSKNNEGFWGVKENAGELLTVVTPPDYTFYKHMWRSVSNRFFITFKVQACKDAHVLLASSIGNAKTQIYEVLFGGGGNTWSGIREKALSGPVVAAKTPDLLYCDRSRSLWISWNQNRITMGKGSYYNHAPILTYEPNGDIHPVNYIAISTFYGVKGDWTFEEDVGDMMVFNTQQGQSYGLNWIYLRSSSSITFDVQARGDAGILLAVNPEDTSKDIYEIIIGYNNNNKTGIRLRIGGSFIREAETPGILIPFTKNRFWITWETGRVRFGKGGVIGENLLLDYQNQVDIPITAMAMACPPQMFSLWYLRENVGWHYRVKTFTWPLDIFKQSVWRDVRHRWNVRFAVKACQNAEVLLSDATLFAADGYRLVIGGWNNQRTVIERALDKNAPKMIEVDTPKILDCNNFRYFWLEWYNGVITFGTGETVGRDRVLAWEDVSPTQIRSLQFSTKEEENNAVIWDMLVDDADPDPMVKSMRPKHVL